MASCMHSINARNHSILRQCMRLADAVFLIESCSVQTAHTALTHIVMLAVKS